MAAESAALTSRPPCDYRSVAEARFVAPPFSNTATRRIALDLEPLGQEAEPA
ncbi:MAG: hypothetical protein KY467_04720 [Gemmatimonadetes bacterium]|nr:hypothetical protein [Gemmatimonadota bacterium]